MHDLGEDYMNLKRKIDALGIGIVFSGRFSQEIIEELGSALTKYLESEATLPGQVLKVFAVYIELTQNINNYLMGQSAWLQDNSFLNSGLIAIGRRDGSYCLHSGNLVLKKDVPALGKRLDDLKSLSAEELRILYREQMSRCANGGEYAAERGAGLGLIDICRKAVRPVEYTFIRYSDELEYFFIEVTV